MTMHARPAAPARPTTLADFLAWEAGQEQRHEFRRGQIRMMAGGALRNTRIAQNIASALNTRLPASAGRAYVRAKVALAEAEAGYYPDVVVDCGAYEPDSQVTAEPVVVFEVLSPTTRDRDFSEKVPDYRDTRTIRQIVLVETEKRLLHVWVWDDQPARWRETTVEGEEAVLKLPALEFALPLADIYRNA